MDNRLKTYHVTRIDENEFHINGKADHFLWDRAESLTDFCSPWDSTKIKTIEFKALWDNSHLFCCFKVHDPEIYTDTTDNSKSSINHSDRVELFFRRDKNMNPYYCLEIDPTPRLMDFKAMPNKEFDFNWDWPKNDISIKSDIKTSVFTVEIAISLDALKKFGLLNNGKIETGIYRAKYSIQENGRYEPTWITWVNPHTETPNFHIPTSFGALKFKDFKSS